MYNAFCARARAHVAQERGAVLCLSSIDGGTRREKRRQPRAAGWRGARSMPDLSSMPGAARSVRCCAGAGGRGGWGQRRWRQGLALVAFLQLKYKPFVAVCRLLVAACCRLSQNPLKAFLFTTKR